MTINGWCWVDVRDLTPRQQANLRHALTIQPERTSEHQAVDPEPLHLYVDDDEGGRFGIPRSFYQSNTTQEHREVLKISDGEPMQPFENLMRYEGPFEEQAQAIDFLVEHTRLRAYGGFIFQADPGTGKTNVALSFAYRLGRKTLVLVHKTFLLNQWKRRIEQFMPGARVGIVRQNRCEYEDVDFAIGMLDSIVGDREYPKGFYSAFGLVITDEAHRVGSKMWSRAQPLFNARWRVGLTATPRRKDGAIDAFLWHIGPIVYKMKTTSLVPHLRVISTENQLRSIMKWGKVRGKSELSTSDVIDQLTADGFRTRTLMEDISIAVSRGRKVMVLSERIEHIASMAKDLQSLLDRMNLPFTPVIDFYTGEWFTGERDDENRLVMDKKKNRPKMKVRTEDELREAERANVIFCTAQLTREALDIEAADVMMLATPMSDVEQAIGRIRRVCMPEQSKCKRLCPWRAGVCPGKPHPIIVDVVDSKVPAATRKWRSRRTFYRGIGIM